MGRKRKPLVDLDVKCPHCSATMDVKVYRKRIGTPEPADYEYDQQIQLTLPGLPLRPKAKEAALAKG